MISIPDLAIAVSLGLIGLGGMLYIIRKRLDLF